jgi:enamine deaminase RidA (YjgF/YER057c/UK114 family)
VFNRIFPSLLICLLASGILANAQKKKVKPYSELPVIQSKDTELDTQVLPPPKEPRAVVAAETGKLTFSLVPLSRKGLLSQQTREALHDLVRGRDTVVKLRAFVAGSGDARRVLEIAGEMFAEKHRDVPALSVVQAGALPLEGAQIALEVTTVGKKVVNPNGLGFFSAQVGPSIAGAASKLSAEFAKAGLQPADALRVTCFVNSLDAAGDWRGALNGFSAAAVNVVQMMREAVGPAAACEAVARLTSAPSAPVSFLDSSPDASAAVLVNTPQLIFTGIQMVFGQKPGDVRQAYQRLNSALNGVNSSFGQMIVTGTYLLLTSVKEPAREIRAEMSGKQSSPAETVLPFEGLASSDATMGIDGIAAPR